MKNLTSFIIEKLLINKDTIIPLNYKKFCNLIHKNTGLDIDNEDFLKIISESISGNMDINEDISFIDKTDKEEINYYKTHIRINTQYNKYYLICKNDEGHLFAYYNRSRKESSKYYPYVLIVGYDSTYLGKRELRLFELQYKYAI